MRGKAEALDGILEAFRTGPRHPGFLSALVGYQGVGKTSLLDAIGSRGEEELGWPVLHHPVDALGRSVGRHRRRVAIGAREVGRLGREYRRLETQLKVAVNLGVVSAEATATSPSGIGAPGAGAAVVRKVFHDVGAFAAAHDTGVLLTINEASTAREADLATLAGVIQVEVNRGRLPVAVLFAGLPSFRDAIAAAGTFAERLTIQSVEDLRTDESRLALIEPAARLHVRWHPAALDAVVAESGGHPYYVQLFGYHTWEQAGASDELTVADARAGIRAGIAVLQAQFDVTWARLRPQEQTFMAVTAELGGAEAVLVTAVATRMGRTSAQLDVTRHRLVHDHGLLRAPRRGEVQFRSGHRAAWVRAAHPSPVAQPPVRPRQRRHPRPSG